MVPVATPNRLLEFGFHRERLGVPVFGVVEPSCAWVTSSRRWKHQPQQATPKTHRAAPSRPRAKDDAYSQVDVAY
jgi:hypothetical protein